MNKSKKKRKNKNKQKKRNTVHISQLESILPSKPVPDVENNGTEEDSGLVNLAIHLSLHDDNKGNEEDEDVE